MSKKNRRFYDADEVDKILEFYTKMQPLGKQFCRTVIGSSMDELTQLSEILEEDIRKDERSKIKVKVKNEYLNSKDVEWYNCYVCGHWCVFTYNKIDRKTISGKYNVYNVNEIINSRGHRTYELSDDITENFIGTLVQREQLKEYQNVPIKFNQANFKIMKDPTYKGMP